MPAFNQRSRDNLDQCHPDLQRLFNDVVRHFDCSVICGHRGKAEQEAVFKAGKSKARFGESKHNHVPSMAVDVVPYPVDWQDRERFAMFAGFVLGRAIELGVNVRWGGDWDRDTKTADETFLDMPHFELMDC
ncbi:M15 family metallopeptidase [Endozoicomonas ascidiicola]|uniref:M15 family metallopeptidase n=1 Tax=Endozoicomonas ascidiicola TaxID=1698521 RepID=UPI000833B114|nr:M15 family metallopeptidase [Endozoicomonas ascidiicola]